MNKLRFNLKFTLIMLLFLLPLLILAVSYFSEVNRLSKHSESELLGLKAFSQFDRQQSQLISIIAKDMSWRSTQSPPASQTQSIQSFITNLEKLADPLLFDQHQLQSLNQAIRKTATSLADTTSSFGNPQWTPIDRFEQLEASIKQFNSLYLTVANLKGLTNDPQVDTVILSRLLTEKRQLALNLLSKSYAVASFAVGENAVSSGTFDSLSLANDYSASNLITVKNLSSLSEGLDPQLRQLITRDVETLVKLIEESMLFLEDQFLLADEVKLDAQQLDQYYGAQLKKFYDSKRLLSLELEKRLKKRLEQNSTNIFSVSLLVTMVLFAVIYLFVGMSLSISLTTNNLASIAQKLADGDTRVSATVKTRDELADAIRAFNQMARNVHDLVKSVQNASQGVAQQSDNVEQLANQTGSAVNEQLQDTQAITTAINNLLVAVSIVSENSQKVMQALTQANQQTEQGKQTLAGARQATDELGEEIKLSVEVINNLSQQSNSINQVLEVIKSIAEQTNLLALNAAIEAARAGDQGRGFAVVADEVRSLAKRTHESTEEIQTTITSLQEGVSNAVEAMRRSDDKALRSIAESAKLEDALSQITHAVIEISQQNSATEQASVQQTEIASEIEARLNSISQISTVTEKNVRESVSASQKLAEHVTKLESVVANFKT